MRLFTAIDIPAEVRTSLQFVVDGLRPLASLRWSPMENLHVTTKFIGEWPEARVEDVDRALSSVSRPGPIEIAIRGLGWYPNPHSPRVFFAGVEADEALHTLAAATERALMPIGVPAQDRTFRPHLTFARTKERQPALLRAVAAMENQDFGAFTARVQHLYLSAAGKYTKLYDYSLIPQ